MKTKLSGTKTKLWGTKTKIRGTTTKRYGTKTKLRGKTSKCCDTKTKLRECHHPLMLKISYSSRFTNFAHK